jgi:hypothetical protein
MKDGVVRARKLTPVPAIMSSIASDAVTYPAFPATAVPRPSAVISTTRRTLGRLSASQADRVNDGVRH